MRVPVFLYKKRLDEKLGACNFESTEECYHHLVNCIHQAAKEAKWRKEFEKQHQVTLLLE